MAGETPVTIGTRVTCSDGASGWASRVVIDPASLAVTHLVVEPEDRHEPGRLVPLDLVHAAAGSIGLRCTKAEFYQLSQSEKRQFVPGTGDYARYQPGQLTRRAIYLQRQARPGFGVSGRMPQSFTYDTVLDGEVALRGGDPVHATDGQFGQIQGIAMDQDSHRVTHLLLRDTGVLGGKRVAIPISTVTRVDTGIQLNITRRQVRHLPRFTGSAALG
jgi:sporulation protein YlmC with PRC-barrel domain